MRSTSLLRSFFVNDSDTFNSVEGAQVTRLVAANQELIMNSDGSLDTKSEEGCSACNLFLETMEASSQALKLVPAPRSYREEFTINYRSIFRDQTRSYRMDIFDASVDQYFEIWVNGEHYKFSGEARSRGVELEQAFTQLRTCLSLWATNSTPARSELQTCLTTVDHAWACFEHKYIVELISVEEKSRQLIVDAIKHEQRLQQLERNPEKNKTSDYYKEVEHLVKAIAKLNSVANIRRKGRDDLSAAILFDAEKTLKRCAKGDQEFSDPEAAGAARILAKDVVDSFRVMRSYLQEVKKCLERVDPHLCNNAGLVARLVDWEESWEIGATYVQHEPLLHALCEVVAVARAAQRLAPALIEMCNDCDVELFMVLPRLIWLRFLAAPTQVMELLKTLLPHRFQLHSTYPWDANLAAFIEHFWSVDQLIRGDAQDSSVHPTTWETLVKRVVSGERGEKAYGHLPERTRPGIELSAEALLRELEGYSIELQRHAASDWNQCSAIIIQCLTSASNEEDKVSFHV